ncbi:SET domain-containing protein SmydA-8 isoform X2 [Plodia interpunctella]|uniref:SET domain-containing protein SmydA-8 isoform X2 n=1 Tax=Plodia interpunctella TaxID=58824 RepID=UPI002367AC33|nr:SET domain-containing protein SmydA-8 isoform X2 [Plodia interpunctella]
MRFIEDKNVSFEHARTSEELGRYLVAARDLAPGDLVLTERPLVFGPKSQPNPEAAVPCVGCYKLVTADAGERCSRCGWPVCSGHCPGLTNSRHHGVECHILSVRPECVLDNIADYYRYDALLPLRCMLLQIVDPEKWKKLSDMQSHMECRLPGSEAYDEANEFIVEYLMNNFINKLENNVKKKYFPDISAELVHKMCGIIDTNALEIRVPDGVELLALFTNTCIMEHSCIPNTKHTFTQFAKDKNDLYRITVKVVVPVEKGNHITTMYSHALWGTQARRQHLKDTKYFACRCLRCSDPTEFGTYLSAMKCLGDGNQVCDGIHLPEDPLDDETDWACNKCSIKVNNSQVNMIITQMGEEVENVQMIGISVTMLENLLCRLSTFLHPNHYHLYSIKHSLIQLYGRQPNYMSEEILDKKIKMCKDLIAITKILDPGNSRLSLYNAVLQHELHSALLCKAKKVKCDGSMETVGKIKYLMIEAKSAIEIALDSLKDDIEETSGKKLFKVIVNSKKDFEKFCKENKGYF